MGCHGVIRAKQDLVTKPPPHPHKVVRIAFRNFYIKNILSILSCSLYMTELIDSKHQQTQHLNCLPSKPLQSYLALVTPWTIASQVSLSMGFSRQEHWSGLLSPSPGYLPDPRIEPVFLMTPALTGGFFTTSTTWEAQELSYTPMSTLYESSPVTLADTER